ATRFVGHVRSLPFGLRPFWAFLANERGAIEHDRLHCDAVSENGCVSSCEGTCGLRASCTYSRRGVERSGGARVEIGVLAGVGGITQRQRRDAPEVLRLRAQQRV